MVALHRRHHLRRSTVGAAGVVAEPAMARPPSIRAHSPGSLLLSPSGDGPMGAQYGPYGVERKIIGNSGHGPMWSSAPTDGLLRISDALRYTHPYGPDTGRPACRIPYFIVQRTRRGGRPRPPVPVNHRAVNRRWTGRPVSGPYKSVRINRCEIRWRHGPPRAAANRQKLPRTA